MTIAPGTGTAITLTVPGRVIFRRASTRLASVCSILSGTDAFGELVFNCTQGTSSLAALQAAGAANLDGKTVVDVAMY